MQPVDLPKHVTGQLRRRTTSCSSRCWTVCLQCIASEHRRSL